VFVFAIQISREPALYDVLEVNQWRFHLVSADDVREHGTRSVGVSFLRRYAPEPVGFEGLAEAIEAARRHPA
jgi:hypothetical protein